MCLTNLESFDDFAASNQALHSRYATGLSGLPGIVLAEPPASAVTNYQYATVEIDADICPLDRDTILAVLWAEGILARRYFYPGCHNMEPYKTHLAGYAPPLPNTEILCRRILVLPTGAGVQAGQVDLICEIIRDAIRQSQEVRFAVNADSLLVSEEERRRRTDRVPIAPADTPFRRAA
jgi:dTDP-4-amino-4,6-dideoxygalactose transaminase